MNSKILGTIIAALAVGFIANALVSWRTIGVVQNDIKHLEALIVDTREDVRELRRFFREP